MGQHTSRQARRDAQAAWVIVITLAAGSIVSGITRSALVAAGFVTLAVIEWRLAVFRERVEQHHNTRRSPAHPRMGA